MAKKLELNFSVKNDAEIIRFIQLNKDDNTSPLFICALEYYIKTNQFLNIGNVCLSNIDKANDKVRKPIYVPNNSPVEEWANKQKEQRKGLLSAKVRHILKNSIQRVENSDDEEVADYIECLLKVENLVPETRYVEKKDIPLYSQEIKTEEKPVVGVISNLSVPKIDDTNKNKVLVKSEKKKASMMDKLMPPSFDDD